MAARGAESGGGSGSGSGGGPKQIGCKASIVAVALAIKGSGGGKEAAKPEPAAEALRPCEAAPTFDGIQSLPAAGAFLEDDVNVSDAPVERQLAKLTHAISALAAASQHTFERLEVQQHELRLAMDEQQLEMRRTVSTLVTQVNDVSRTLTESTRAASRWM